MSVPFTKFRIKRVSSPQAFFRNVGPVDLPPVLAVVVPLVDRHRQRVVGAPGPAGMAALEVLLGAGGGMLVLVARGLRVGVGQGCSTHMPAIGSIKLTLKVFWFKNQLEKS